EQDAGTVALQRISTRRATMRQILEDLQSLANDCMAFPSFDMRDKADAAAVVLISRVVKTLSRRWRIPAIGAHLVHLALVHLFGSKIPARFPQGLASRHPRPKVMKYTHSSQIVALRQPKSRFRYAAHRSAAKNTCVGQKLALNLNKVAYILVAAFK